MKKLVQSRSVFSCLAAVLGVGMALVSCQNDSPTAPEAPEAAAVAPASNLGSTPEGSRVGPAGVAPGLITAAARGRRRQVEVCHVDQETMAARVISVAEPAVAAHQRHGDQVNETAAEICDDGIDNDCNGVADDGEMCEPPIDCPCDYNLVDKTASVWNGEIRKSTSDVGCRLEQDTAVFGDNLVAIEAADDLTDGPHCRVFFQIADTGPPVVDVFEAVSGVDVLNQCASDLDDYGDALARVRGITVAGVSTRCATF